MKLTNKQVSTFLLAYTKIFFVCFKAKIRVVRNKALLFSEAKQLDSHPALGLFMVPCCVME